MSSSGAPAPWPCGTSETAGRGTRWPAQAPPCASCGRSSPASRVPLFDSLEWAGLLGQQLLDLLGVRGGEGHLASQPPGAPARLVLEQVLTVRATAQHLPGTGQPEALVRSAVRLHLWHARRRLSLLRACGAALSCAPRGWRHAARRLSTSSAGKLPRGSARPRWPPATSSFRARGARRGSPARRGPRSSSGAARSP